MLNSSVLVLNRSYLPIHVTSVRRAFAMVYQDLARVVDDRYEILDFESWRRIATLGDCDVIGTPSGWIRVPRVILLRVYDRIPKRHVRYSRANVFARDKFTCQYCGVRPPRSQLNLDHVIPRSLGGRTTWGNVVCSCVDCNRRKGGRTPEQARIGLRRNPTRPRWSPLMNVAVSSVHHEEWTPFLRIIDGGNRAVRFAEPVQPQRREDEDHHFG
jgi:5-methylcytosine-specific restriction endonuclease McrA